MLRRTSTLLAIMLTLGLFGCDHATKHLAETSLRGQPPVVLVSDVLDLRYTQNRDIAFSLLRHVPEGVRRPLIFVGATAGLGLVAFLFWQRRRAGWQERLGYAIVLAGALGNLTDRMARGYVVDFVHLHHWPVFNVADICVVVGVGLLLLGSRGREVSGRV
jgi:signal peptidase II